MGQLELSTGPLISGKVRIEIPMVAGGFSPRTFIGVSPVDAEVPQRHSREYH